MAVVLVTIKEVEVEEDVEERVDAALDVLLDPDVARPCGRGSGSGLGGLQTPAGDGAVLLLVRCVVAPLVVVVVVVVVGFAGSGQIILAIAWPMNLSWRACCGVATASFESASDFIARLMDKAYLKLSRSHAVLYVLSNRSNPAWLASLLAIRTVVDGRLEAMFVRRRGVTGQQHVQGDAEAERETERERQRERGRDREKGE